MSGIVTDALLRAIDKIRGIPDQLGVAPFTVAVRVVTWSGSRVGVGTRTVTDTPVKVSAGARNPDVRRLTSTDVIASGGLYTATDLRVGPLTPGYAGGGMTAAQLDPAPGSSPTEVSYVVTGPGIPSGGVLYKRVGGEMASSTQYFVVIRSTGERATPA